MIKIGIQLASLGLPLKRALQTAARLGATGVELDARRDIRPQELTGTARRQLRKMLDDLQLSVTAVRFPTRRGYNVTEDLDRRVAGTKEAMSLAYALGTNILVNAIGRIPEDPESSSWSLLVNVLEDIGRHGQHCGAMLAAETGSESPESMQRLITALPDGFLGVNFDPGNLIVNGYSASEAARLLGPYVRHVHAKDGVQDLAQGRGIEVQLGRGSVDFEELIAIFDQHNYRGYYTIECGAREHAIEAVGEAVQYLRRL